MAAIFATTKLAAAILAAATIFSMVEAAAQPSYTLTPLRLPAAPTCEMHSWLTPYPTGINDASEIARLCGWLSIAP
jgi:hypothetical protein